MNSKESVFNSTNHKEPDKVPFEIGEMSQPGLHNTAHRELRDRFGHWK